MRLTLVRILLALATVSCTMARAQGTFQNLDFEDANIPPSTPVNSPIPISEALPDWSAYSTVGTTITPIPQIGYDELSLGGPAIAIIDANAPDFPPLQGGYSAFLFSGGNPPVVSVSISQTGVVPAGTHSVQFDAYTFAAPFVVTLGGQTINMTPLQTFAHLTLWGGNVPSSFAGQSEALTFTEQPPPAGTGPPGFFELDNISFSPVSVIPEPGPLSLMGIGAALFAAYRRSAPRNQ